MNAMELCQFGHAACACCAMLCSICKACSDGVLQEARAVHHHNLSRISIDTSAVQHWLPPPPPAPGAGTPAAAGESTTVQEGPRGLRMLSLNLPLLHPASPVMPAVGMSNHPKLPLLCHETNNICYRNMMIAGQPSDRQPADVHLMRSAENLQCRHYQYIQQHTTLPRLGRPAQLSPSQAHHHSRCCCRKTPHPTSRPRCPLTGYGARQQQHYSTTKAHTVLPTPLLYSLVSDFRREGIEEVTMVKTRAATWT
jgi:hypothetical protein